MLTPAEFCGLSASALTVLAPFTQLMRNLHAAKLMKKAKACGGMSLREFMEFMDCDSGMSILALSELVACAIGWCLYGLSLGSVLMVVTNSITAVLWIAVGKTQQGQR